MKLFKIRKKLSVLALIIAIGVAGVVHSASLVNLGTAGNFTILAKTGISTIGTTSIIGDIGVSPYAATFITGFGLIMDPSVQWSTSSLVTGKVYAADYTPPTPANMSTAISDMETAYTDAAGRAPGATELGAGDISGMTLAPGVYKWSTNLLINTDVTLAGNPTDVWIFEIAQDFNIASATNVVLSGGALAQNIFWQVAGQAVLGTTSIVNGNILCQTAIIMNTGATLNGKALAQSAVTLDANSVNSPAAAVPYPTPTVTPTVTATPTMQPTVVACNQKFFVFPSPAKGSTLNVVYTMCFSGKVEVRVWNDNGDLVASLIELKSAGAQKSQIDVNKFAPGIYLYRVVLNYSSGKVETSDVQKFGVIK